MVDRIWEPLEAVLTTDTAKVTEYKKAVKEKFESKYKGTGYLLTARVLIAMHMDAISLASAMKLIDSLMDVELLFNYGSDSEGYDPELIFNILGDELMLMDKEQSDMRKTTEDILPPSWPELFVYSKSLFNSYKRAKMLLAMYTEKCVKFGEVVCEDENDLKMWRHFAELTLSSHVIIGIQLDRIDDCMDLLYRYVQENALFTSYVGARSESHAMATYVERVDVSNLTVKLYNSGYGHQFLGGTTRERWDEFYKSYQKFKVQLGTTKLAHYFVIIDLTENEITKDHMNRLYDSVGEKLDDPKHTWFWSYQRTQKSETCTVTSIWYWLRDQGYDGLFTELYIKGRMIQYLKQKKEEFEGFDVMISDYQNMKPIYDLRMLSDDEVYKFFELEQKIRNTIKGKHFEDFARNPRVFEPLVSSGINEILEYVIWLSGKDEVANSKKKLIYQKILLLLVGPIRDNKAILQNINQNIRSLAKFAREKVPVYMPAITEVPLSKVSPITAAKKIELECCEGLYSATHKCYETIFEVLNGREEIAPVIITALKNFSNDLEKRSIYMQPYMAYMIAEALNNKLLLSMKYYYNQAKLFQLPKFKNQEEYDELMNFCTDSDELSSIPPSSYAMALCTKFARETDKLRDPSKVPQEWLFNGTAEKSKVAKINASSGKSLQTASTQKSKILAQKKVPLGKNVAAKRSIFEKAKE